MQNFSNNNLGYNECVNRGVCSVLPSVAALQEILMIIIKHTAFYISELNKYDIDISVYAKDIINVLVNYISASDYCDTQLLSIVNYSYENLLNAQKTYFSHCKENSIKPKYIRPVIKLNPNMNLSQIISLGEKAFQNKYKKYSLTVKNFMDLLVITARSLADNIVRYYFLGGQNPQTVNLIINAINILNNSHISVAKLRSEISNIVNADFTLSSEICVLQEKTFGEINQVEISHSTKSGKAILVSGSSLIDLMDILDKVNGDDVDVYTHGEMIVAHCYSKFLNYKNLAGHFGDCYDNCLLDFATFPGAICLTQDANVNTEYLYRGRLFSTSPIMPSGIIKIQNKDFTSLIKSAKDAKGFAKGQSRPSEIVGYDMPYLDKIIKNLDDMIRDKIIEKIVFFDFTKNSLKIFSNILKILPNNFYVVSFSGDLVRKENFVSLNFGNNKNLIRYTLSRFKNIFDKYSNKISFLGDGYSLPSVAIFIYLTNNKIQDLYVTKNITHAISPGLENFIRSAYGIKSISDFKISQ